MLSEITFREKQATINICQRGIKNKNTRILSQFASAMCLKITIPKTPTTYKVSFTVFVLRDTFFSYCYSTAIIQ